MLKRANGLSWTGTFGAEWKLEAELLHHRNVQVYWALNNALFVSSEFKGEKKDGMKREWEQKVESEA